MTDDNNLTLGEPARKGKPAKKRQTRSYATEFHAAESRMTFAAGVLEEAQKAATQETCLALVAVALKTLRG